MSVDPRGTPRMVYGMPGLEDQYAKFHARSARRARWRARIDAAGWCFAIASLMFAMGFECYVQIWGAP